MIEEEYDALTAKQQRIKVAELCHHPDYVKKYIDSLTEEECTLGAFCEVMNMEKEYLKSLPDYLNDLNACHEFENTLKGNSQKMSYYIRLHRIVNHDHEAWDLPTTDKQFNNAHATAKQRCKAFALIMDGE
jgi:hypothetical protein